MTAIREYLIERDDFSVSFGYCGLERIDLVTAIREYLIERDDFSVSFGYCGLERTRSLLRSESACSSAETLASRSASALLSSATWLSAAS